MVIDNSGAFSPKTIRLQPFVSAGEVIARNDGTFEIVPMQIFRSGDNVILRIGHSTFWFDKDGRYDGPEMNSVLPEQLEEVSLMLKQCMTNKGKSPENSYFKEGTEGHHNEIKTWKK